MKKAVCILLVITLLTVFTVGCSTDTKAPAPSAPSTSTPDPATPAPAKQIKLVASHVAPESHHYADGFAKMKEILEEKSNGEITLEAHANAILGEEEETIELMQSGTLDMATVSAAPMTGFVDKYMACDLPFMFASPEEAYEFYDGPIGDELLEMTEEIGVIGLCWWENGFRNFTNDVKPIEKPEDLVGMKIRTMSSPVHVASMKALGANPTVIPFGELYSALQQGVVDGEENPIALIYSNKFYEVQDYLTLSRHFYDPSPLYISKITWDKLTADQQKIVMEAAIEARDYSRDIANSKEDGYIKEIEDSGTTVTILTPEQIQAFQEATKDVYKEFVDIIGEDFLNRFVEAARK